MDMNDVGYLVEAVLFASGEPVPLSALADALELDEKDCGELMHNIMSRYNYERRGLKMVRLGNSFQLCSRPEFAEKIRSVLEKKPDGLLSNAAMEVLSVIAYKQPVTRAYVDQVRGVDSGGVVATLCDRGLIEEKGRLDVPGRPFVYGTTDAFMRVFGISDLSELPPLPERDLPADENQIAGQVAMGEPAGDNAVKVSAGGDTV